jgi:hypothetical protein
MNARPLACSAVAAAVLLVRVAAADCPPSTFFYGGLDPASPIPKVAPRCDTTFSIAPCDRVHGRYDVPAGLLIASIDVACAGFPIISGLETVVEDDFQLVGAAPGTPVSFTVRLHLSGEGHNFSAPGDGGGARVRGTILEGTSNSASLQRATSNPFENDFFVNETISRPSRCDRRDARPPAPRGARGVIRWPRADGRPAGDQRPAARRPARLLPRVRLGCAGPARTVSWGRLKARYR